MVKIVAAFFFKHWHWQAPDALSKFVPRLRLHVTHCSTLPPDQVHFKLASASQIGTIGSIEKLSNFFSQENPVTLQGGRGEGMLHPPKGQIRCLQNCFILQDVSMFEHLIFISKQTSHPTEIITCILMMKKLTNF